jgi:hypothetical protein
MYLTFQAENWEPLNSEAKYSHSVVDLFALLDPITSTFYELIRNIFPLGNQTSQKPESNVDKMCQILTGTIRAYAFRVSKTLDLRFDELIEPRAPENKTDASAGEESSVSGKALLSKFKKRLDKIKSSSRSSSIPKSCTVSIPGLPVERIAVRLCCLKQTWKQLFDLRENFLKFLTDMGSIFSEFSSGISNPDPENKRAPFDSIRYRVVFDKALQDVASCLSSGLQILAERMVKHNLKNVLYRTLYFPTPAESRILDGPFVEELIGLCQDVFTKIESDMEEDLVSLLLSQIISGLVFICSDKEGTQGRCFHASDAEIISEDLVNLQESFVRNLELPASEIAEITKPLNDVLIQMSYSTEQVINLYRRNEIRKETARKILESRLDDSMAQRFMREQYG